MNSICIATYNGEKYIKEQLESIISQIAPDDEIIISDDGSTDKTINIIESLNDRRITIYSNVGMHGFKNNFENAIKRAKGNYIYMSDQDDVWFPDKYNTILQYLKQNDLIHHNSELTNGNLEPYGKTLYEECNNRCGFWHNLKKTTYYGSHMAFHSSLLKYALPFPKTNELGHDVWLGFIATMIGKVYFADEKLMYYRRHEDAFCAFFKSNRPLYKKIWTRIVVFFCEIKFIIFHIGLILKKSR